MKQKNILCEKKCIFHNFLRAVFFCQRYKKIVDKLLKNIERNPIIFLSVNWLPQGQLWAIIEGTMTLTQY